MNQVTLTGSMHEVGNYLEKVGKQLEPKLGKKLTWVALRDFTDGYTSKKIQQAKSYDYAYVKVSQYAVLRYKRPRIARRIDGVMTLCLGGILISGFSLLSLLLSLIK